MTPPWFIVGALYLVLAAFLVRTLFQNGRFQLITLLLGTAVAGGLRFSQSLLTETSLMYVLGGAYLALAAYFFFVRREKSAGKTLLGLGAYLMMADLIRIVARPITKFSFSLGSSVWSDALKQFADYLQVIFQMPQAILMIIYIFLAVGIVGKLAGREKLIVSVILLGLGGTLAFIGEPLAIIGTPYIIIAAFAVRSLPASVRAGVAALQQIDPAIEEASNSLGADAQYTFRKVTLPLITPALLAGLIFSFTRSMTSLSAIIFLVSARWRIVTASILGEWEQGGISFAAAYATVIIVLVLIAIGILYVVTNRLLGHRGDIDVSLGA